MKIPLCYFAYAELELSYLLEEKHKMDAEVSTHFRETATAVEIFLEWLASAEQCKRGGVQKAGTAPGDPALDESPDHAEGKSFKEQANRLMSPGDLLSFFSISLALTTNEYSFLNLGRWVSICLPA